MSSSAPRGPDLPKIVVCRENELFSVVIFWYNYFLVTQFLYVVQPFSCSSFCLPFHLPEHQKEEHQNDEVLEEMKSELDGVHPEYFYSASSSPLLLRGAPYTSQTLCRSFTPKRHRQLRVTDLPKVPT